MRGGNRESPFHAHAVRNFPHGEGSGAALALALDHIAFEALDTLFITFYDFIIDRYIVASFEGRIGRFGGQLLVYECYGRIHNLKFKDGKGRVFALPGKEKSGELGVFPGFFASGLIGRR